MPPYRALVTRSGEDRGKPYFLKNASRLQPGTGKGPQRHCQPKQLRNNPRGCFNAPRSHPSRPPTHAPSPPTTHPSSPAPIRKLCDILQPVIPGENRNIPPPSFRRRPESRGAGGLPSVPHEVEPATSHNRHPRPPKCHEPSEAEESKPFLGTESPPSQTAPRPSSHDHDRRTCYHASHIPHTVVPCNIPQPTKPSFRRRPEPKCVGGLPLRRTRSRTADIT